MLKLLKYLKSYIGLIIITIILTLGQVMTNLELPVYMAKIINEGVLKGQTNIIISNGLVMLFISLIGAIFMVSAGYFAARVATSFSMKMREEIFAKVESFSLTEFNKFSTSSLITRSTNDIQQIQMVMFMIMRMMLIAPLTGIGAIYKAFETAPSMTWIMGLGILALLIIILILFITALPRYKKLQKLVDKLNLITRENLTGLRVIRAFNAEKYEQNKFEKTNIELTRLNLILNRLMALMHPMMMLIFNFVSLGIIWVAAGFIGQSELAVGDMIAFMEYAMQVLFSFTMMSIMFIMIPRASVSGNRVAEVLSTNLTIKDPEHPKQFSDKLTGTLEFKNVTFEYPGAEAPILDNISFKANMGETVAILGGTGSGKSTVVNLIPRFYDVTQGQILMNDVDIRNLNIKDLHNTIGYVPQKSTLFSGTIASNIKYGAPEASDLEMQNAAETAQATEFINAHEDKFQQFISQGGSNISGGQKQRVSIARALVKKPQFYIFDDSFSALDFKTDAALRQALKSETNQATVLIVAQRISTVIDADNIIVIDHGKIVGQGKHHELFKSCEVYKEIALSQLSEKELANKK